MERPVPPETAWQRSFVRTGRLSACEIVTVFRELIICEKNYQDRLIKNPASTIRTLVVYRHKNRDGNY